LSKALVGRYSSVASRQENGAKCVLLTLMPSALVIEDDSAVQALLKKLLESHGYQVTVAGDGLQGLVQLETLTPDIVLCDIMMPNLDGMQFTKAIKAHEDTKKIPVVFLTAKNDAKTMIEGLNIGAKYFLTKPFRHEDLMAKIKKAMSGR
jgi:DNA-binding response OmpR family regulator